LRAISSGQSPSRWQTPSMRCASKWKGAPPLPNLPRPTCAVGSRPVTSPQQFAQCPTVGTGLPLASPFREAWIVGPDGADPRRVCPRQTACHLSPYPAMTGKPAPQPPFGHFRPGCLFPACPRARSGCPLAPLGPEGKRQLTGRPMLEHWPGSAAAHRNGSRCLPRRRAHRVPAGGPCARLHPQAGHRGDVHCRP